LFKRTLLGHILTALLTSGYAGGIVVLVVLLLSWIGMGETPLALVGCTLLLVFLLHPVRRGLQQMINRRYGV
jgi:hypothetical protein